MARQRRTRMDKLDRRLLKALNENSRRSYREIARALKVSFTTVADRVRRLEGAGVIKGYAPIVDARAVGYDLAAAIGIRISRGRLLQVQRRIAEDPHVYGVYDLTGEWDSLVLARFRDRTDLDKFLKRLLTLEWVERTNTSVILNIVKEEPRVFV